MKRIVIPGLPHHVVQRGQAGRTVFLKSEDYQFYIETLAKVSRTYSLEILAYCLMPDHVHLIVVPKSRESMDKSLQSVRDSYTAYIAPQIDQKEQFWQESYASHLLDETHLIYCARYIEINPIKREYVEQPEQWLWSSAATHINQKDDLLVKSDDLVKLVNTPWQEFLFEPRPDGEADLFYHHEKTGQPMGDYTFLNMIQKELGGTMSMEKSEVI